jgi:hypothetical protein
MSDAVINVYQPARDRHIVIGGVQATFNHVEDSVEFDAARSTPPATTAELTQAVLDWLADDAPIALVTARGTIPPGHPLGVPATNQFGR